MELVGKLFMITPIEEGMSKAGRAWKKRMYVVETQETYPRKVAFTVMGEDRINEFGARIHECMDVRVQFDINSRQWQDKWFTDVSAWRIEEVTPNAAAAGAAYPQQPAYNAPAGAPAAPAAAAPAPGAFPPPPAAPAESNDDLPF